MTKRSAPHVVSDADCAVLGTPKTGTTHWTITREKGRQSWILMRTYTTRRDVLQSVLPIALCSVDFIRERWGPGVFKCGWLNVDDDGKATALGVGRRFEVGPVQPAPEVPPAPVPVRKKVKVKRGSLKSQLAVLAQLQAMTRESVNAAVGERVAFIQAEAERNREHQREMARLTMRADRDRQAAAPAPSSSNGNGGTEPDMTAAVAAGIGQIVQKLDAVVEAGGDKSDLMRVGEMLGPGFNKIVGIVEKIVLDKLGMLEEVPDANDDDRTDA